MSFHSQQSFSISFFHVSFKSLGLTAPRLPSICISHVVLTAPLERSICPNQRSLLSQNEVEVIKLESLDLTVATSSHSSGLISTPDLSDHGPTIALQVRLGQWPSFTGLVSEVEGCENPGSSSLNFFQAVFTRVVTVISQPPPADSMSTR